jgi:hypothetical protein
VTGSSYGSVTSGASTKTNLSHFGTKCILISATLCDALHDGPVFVLMTAQTTAVFADGITTKQSVSRGNVEIDPVTRVLIGRRPTWGRMAPLGAVQVVAETWLAQRMKTSRHAWIRRLWWMPQTIGIVGNTWGTQHNLSLR